MRQLSVENDDKLNVQCYVKGEGFADIEPRPMTAYHHRGQELASGR